MTPMETNAFVDSISSKYVRVHFDTGNISLFHHAEHGILILGKRTKIIHREEFTKKGTDYISFDNSLSGISSTTGSPFVLMLKIMITVAIPALTEGYFETLLRALRFSAVLGNPTEYAGISCPL